MLILQQLVTQQESPITIFFHGLTATTQIAIVIMLARYHKVWIRLKDRTNTLWKRHCETTKDVYIPLEGNGH